MIVQVSGGGDGSVRLWHTKPAINAVQNVHTMWLDSAPFIKVRETTLSPVGICRVLDVSHFVPNFRMLSWNVHPNVVNLNTVINYVCTLFLWCILGYVIFS